MSARRRPIRRIVMKKITRLAIAAFVAVAFASQASAMQHRVSTKDVAELHLQRLPSAATTMGTRLLRTRQLLLAVPTVWQAQFGQPPALPPIRAWDPQSNCCATDVVADVEQGSAHALQQAEAAYDRSDPSAQGVRLSQRRLPGGGRALVVSYSIPFGGIPRGGTQLQYFVQRSAADGTVWLTFTTQTARLGHYQAVFDRIAGSAQPLVTQAEAAAPKTHNVGYIDPIGDAHGAPDISSILVSSDAHGTIRFTLRFAKAFPINGSEIGISIDSDRNVHTGDVAGFDYRIDDSDGHASLVALSPIPHPQPSPTLHVHLAGTTMTATINRTDLGDTPGFYFYAWTQAGTTYGDDAPGGSNVLTYTLPTPSA
jgi:hypothetical protein